MNFLTSTCATECSGDCDGNQAVAINELLMLVNIALGNATAPACIAGDANRDGIIGMSELITAVNNALEGCSDGTPPFVATFESATCEIPLPEGQDPANVSVRLADGAREPASSRGTDHQACRRDRWRRPGPIPSPIRW